MVKRYSSSRTVHISELGPIGRYLPWDRTVQTYLTLHGDAPQYLRQFTSVADIPIRQRLRSSTSDDLFVPAVRLPTVGRRAFSVAGARV